MKFSTRLIGALAIAGTSLFLLAVLFSSDAPHKGTTPAVQAPDKRTSAEVAEAPILGLGEPPNGDVASQAQALPAGAWHKIVKQLRRARYEIAGESGDYLAVNPAHGLRAEFTPSGPRLVSHGESEIGWELGFTLTEYGYADQLQAVSQAALVSSGNRIEYRRGGLTEWYINDRRGLEQGFTLSAPPGERSGAPLVVAMSLSGTLAPQVNDAGRALSFSDTDGNSVLSYGGLRAWDSTGRDLPARLEVRALRASGGARIAILVDDAAARYPVTIDPLLTQVAKLTASDAAPGDFFGVSVAIAGDTAVVGAQLGDGAVSDSGSAYVFGRNQGGTDNWGQVAKLTALDGAPVDRFGRSVAIAGETVVVGALGDDDAGGASGSAYVFGRNEGGPDNWGQVAKLTASDAAPGDEFGTSVAIAGETAVVGARLDDDAGLSSGSAYVFGRDVSGADNWGEVAKLTASDAAPGDFFGVSVAIAGDTAVVGAQLGDGAVSDSGSAYVFGRNQGGTDNWGQVAKLTASDAAAGDFFGFSVAIAGETVVVGALGDDAPSFNSGSAYVFGRNEGGADMWGEVAKLTASDAAGDDIFGFSVAIAGETVVVGASFNDHAGGTDAGSAYVFGLGLEVPIDIKPGSCPNPLNVKSEGVLPVGILGTEDFDATDVDPTTVLLAGVPMLIFDYEDVATPFEPFVSKEEATDCNDGGPDGFEDITLKFDTQAIVGAISPVDDGDVVVLPLEGELFDGTPIVGEDVVVIRKKGE